MPYESRIPKIAAEITAGIAGVVERTGLRVEAGAKRRARYKTGYMRGQIRWVKHGEFEGEVVAGADYTIFNEYGTVHMSAQPMFGPATEEARPLFDAEIRLVIKKAIRNA